MYLATQPISGGWCVLCVGSGCILSDGGLDCGGVVGATCWFQWGGRGFGK